MRDNRQRMHAQNFAFRCLFGITVDKYRIVKPNLPTVK